MVWQPYKSLHKTIRASILLLSDVPGSLLQAQHVHHHVMPAPAASGVRSQPQRASFRRCRPRRQFVVASAKLNTKIGFRWDPANSRWIRDDRMAGSIGKTGVTMKTLSGGEYTAEQLAQKGWTFVDVRLPNQFEKGRPTGAVNVPLYRYVEGDSKWDNLKRLAMASFAMKATERNPDFAKEALSKLGKNKKIIVVCDIGGSLQTYIQYRTDKPPCNDPERSFGRESRSLKAIYELVQAGWSVNNIVHLKGGWQQWRYDGFDCESS